MGWCDRARLSVAYRRVPFAIAEESAGRNRRGDPRHGYGRHLGPMPSSDADAMPVSVLAQQRELDEILGDHAVRSVYQPIVELATGDTVGFEALARGPAGSLLESPEQLFAAARAADRLEELDWECRAAALRGALDAGLDRSVSLFVNVEPQVIGMAPSATMRDLLAEAGRELSVMVEVTERAMVSAPAELLSGLAFVRKLGWGVALDDVGAEVASLALMPFLRPDVMKLDLRLIQQRPDRDVAAIVGAVDAQAERTGAHVLAEGIETSAHLDRALGVGATLGQGWLFAHAGPLSSDRATVGGRLLPMAAPQAPPRSPMDAAASARPTRRSTKPLLVEISRHLERQALDQGRAVVVLGAFQARDRFTPATARIYQDLAGRSTFVAALGLEMVAEPAPGVRGGAIEVDDPLVDEWSIAVVGPHFAGALVAAELGDEGPERSRRFDYRLTYDREVVLTVARSLMARVLPG